MEKGVSVMLSLNGCMLVLLGTQIQNMALEIYFLYHSDPRDSFEYKWKVCQNLMGRFDQNIQNDNCVELQIGKIKKQLNTQGANKSFNSAREHKLVMI